MSSKPPPTKAEDQLVPDLADEGAAIESALKVIGRNAYEAMRPGASFSELKRILFAVATSIAAIHKARLERLTPGGNLALRSTPSQQDDCTRIAKFGIQVASRMLVFARNDVNFERYDLFISHPGEEKGLYIPLLGDLLKKRNSSFNAFLDYENLRSGETIDPPDTMFKAALLSTQLLCVCSFDAVQKAWPIAELLCAFARLAEAETTSHVILDGMPGTVHLKKAPHWVDTLKDVLIFENWTSIFPYKSNDALSHLRALVDRVFDAQDAERSAQVVHPNSGYANKPKGKIQIALLKKKQGYDEVKGLLEGKADGSFTVRASNSKDEGYSGKPLAAFVLKRNSKIVQEFWYFDDSTGEYGLAGGRGGSFPSLADLMAHIGATDFCVGEHEPIVNRHMNSQSRARPKP